MANHEIEVQPENESPILEISSHSELEAYEKTVLALYGRSSNVSDSELLREASLALTIQNEEVSQRIGISDNSFQIKYDYDIYSHRGNEIAQLESEYATRVYLQNGKLTKVVEHLIEFPNSKRAILLLWDDEQTDLTKGAACMTYCFFRIAKETLIMNTHMRANDAYNHLLVDLDVFRQIQQYVASSVGKKVGLYTQFADSLHFYAKDSIFVEGKYLSLRNRD